MADRNEKGLVSLSPIALQATQSLARRAKADAPVRYGFIRRERADDPIPPMIRLLRGVSIGRGSAGGEVRLGLLLSLLWAVRDDPTLTYPARAWAAALDLSDPETAGARRIRNALRWLNDNDFIRLETAPGHDAVVHLLEETGSGRRYELPGATYSRLKNNAAMANPHRYIKLPSQLWTQGWLSQMKGPGIVMLLVLWIESGREVAALDPPWVWLSPKLAEERYALSEETRLKGAKQLTELGLINTNTRAVPMDAFEFRRGRNSHQIQREVLVEQKPGQAFSTGFFVKQPGQSDVWVGQPGVAANSQFGSQDRGHSGR